MFAKSYGHAGRFALAVSLVLPPAFAQSEFQSNRYDLLVALDPVVVTASRFPETRSEASAVVDVITREDMSASGANNLAEFLDLLPGVMITRLYGRLGVDTGIDIGYTGDSSSQNVLVLIDGQRVNLFDQSSVNFVQIPLSSIEQIEVRKANGGVLFGDRAQGGVINVITRSGKAREITVSYGSFGYKKADLYIGMQTPDFSASIAGLASGSDGYRTFNNGKQGSGRISLSKKTSFGELSFSWRSFNENLELPGSLTEEQFFENPRQAASGSSSAIESRRKGESTHIGYLYSLSASSSFALDLHDTNTKQISYTLYRDFPEWGKYRRFIENKRKAVQPRLETQYSNIRLIVGGEFFEAEANTVDDKQVNQKSSAIYAQSSLNIGNKRVLDFGLRSQVVKNSFQADITSPKTQSKDRENAYTIGFRSRPTESLLFRSGYFSGFRFANADELYYYNNDPTDQVNRYSPVSVNPNVDPMKSNEIYAELLYRRQELSLGAHWRTIQTRDEIGVSDNCGEISGIPVGCNTNLFNTNRNILSFFGRTNLAKGFRLSGHIDLIEAKIDNGENSNNRIPVTPKRVVQISLEKELISLGTLKLQMHSRDNMVPSLAYAGSTKKIPSRTVYNLGLQSMENDKFHWSAWVRNLANKSYYDYAVDSFGYGVYPADGRSFEINLKYPF
jgi:iron complex outermembrane recepter protein